jgi:hypothetical protein
MRERVAPDAVRSRVRAFLAPTSLRKDNDAWEDEPRIPAGNPNGGEWTDGDEGGANFDEDDGAADGISTGVERPEDDDWSDDDDVDYTGEAVLDGGGTDYENDEGANLFTDVAYPGTYHDQIVAQIAAHWRSEGAMVLTSVNLVARNGATARADLIAVLIPGDEPVVAEVKTGADPQYTAGQSVVYPMAQIGDHVYSPDQKIQQLGFSPGEWLPPMQFVTIYRKDDDSPYIVIQHEYPIVP